MKGTAVITCLYFFYIVLGQPPKVTYNGNQIWRISYDNKTVLKLLQSLEKEKHLVQWGLHDAMVYANSLNTVQERLRHNNIEYRVAVEDVQKAIDEENPKPRHEFDARKSYRLTWNYYHNLGDIYDYLRYLEETFPKLCTVRSIGRSAEGRPIKLLKISNRKPDNKAIFVEGGIHAREWISPAAVTYIIHQFISNYDKEPTSIKNIDWYFVPVLNPDGYEYSYTVERLWRKNRSKSKSTNCLGADLNRNWGYDWGKNGSSSDPCSNFYRGSRPFSELETAAVATFFINSPDINWVGYISVHSYGQFIVYPWGSPKVVLEDHDDLHKVATEAAHEIAAAGGVSYTVGPVATTIYPATGSSMDWAKGSAAIKYTYTVELRDNGTLGFILPATFIKPTSQEALVIVRTVAKTVNKHGCQN